MDNENNILSDKYEKITIENEETGEKYAVITHDEVMTAQGVTVKMKPLTKI